MPNSASIAAKRLIRKSTRRLGYEISSFRTGFTDLQRRLLTETDLVIDVGANTGQYAELIRTLGFGGEIISFEPMKAAFSRLSHKTNSVPNWHAVPKALASQPGEATLHISANSGSSSLLDIREEHLRAAPRARLIAEETVDVSTLDAEMHEHPSGRAWLKLDVQGAELDVLGGATETLPRVRVVQTEMSFSPLYERQTDYVKLLAFLTERGFLLRHLEPGFQDPDSGFLLQAEGLFVRAP